MAGWRYELFVGVQKQEVIGRLFSQADGFGSVLAEVAPRPLVQFAGQIFQKGANDVLRAVARASVDDALGIDVGKSGAEASLDDMRFVFHDHCQANSRS